VFVCAFLTFALGGRFGTAGSSPSTWLGASTLAFAYFSRPSTLLFKTEVAHIQGGGLALLPWVAQSNWVCYFTIAKAGVSLCLVAFLV